MIIVFTRMNERVTISLPKPDYTFAVEESKKLMKLKKGVVKKNVSLFVSELIADERARRGQKLKAA